MSLDPVWTALWLVLCAAAFAVPGLLYARRQRDGLDSYIAARNTQNTRATVLTLLATSLGTWILFGPAQAATWGGISAVLGYALGSLAPPLVMIPLGRRMRELIPEGHGLTEFVIHRYGRVMYAFTLSIMLFYLFILLAASLTAVAQMVTLLAPIPLGLTAGVVMLATVVYTFYGGLRASIFTDKVQMVVILPLLALLVFFGWQAAGGAAPTLEGLRQRAPELLDVTDTGGVRAGLTFFIAVVLTGLFYQGTWQRIYAAKNIRVLRKSFWISGLFNLPVIVTMGLFGLAFVGLDLEGDGSVALFSVLLDSVPLWFALALIPLGLALVMSSADSTINATSSIIAVDMHRLLPRASEATLMRFARWLIVVAAVPITLVASQGYSVLYLFLLADLLCSAAAFAVFFGLFNRRYDGRHAVISTACGLIAGLVMFPAPGAGTDSLLESFLLAALVPVAASVVLMRVMPAREHYDFARLATLVRRFGRAP